MCGPLEGQADRPQSGFQIHLFVQELESVTRELGQVQVHSRRTQAR